MTPTEAAQQAAAAIRFLNHQTLPGVAQDDGGLDVVEVYDLLGELALMSSRLPQLLCQIEAMVDDLVEAGQVMIVDGPQVGDPVAAAAIAGHWLAASAGAAHELADRLDQAQQALAWGARPDPRESFPS